MPPSSLRPMRRHERALVYGLLGWCTETAFTALHAQRHRATRTAALEGHSYLWMLPIYGSAAYLFEPLHQRLRRRRPQQRALSYAAGFLAVEYACGRGLQRAKGSIPWDYTGRSRLAVRGAIRLDYAPLWAVAGLGLERVHDLLKRVRLSPDATATGE